MTRTIVTPATNAALDSSAIRAVLQSLLDDIQLKQTTFSASGTGQTITLDDTPTGFVLVLYRGAIYFEQGADKDFTIVGAVVTFNKHVESGDAVAVLSQKADF